MINLCIKLPLLILLQWWMTYVKLRNQFLSPASTYWRFLAVLLIHVYLHESTGQQKISTNNHAPLIINQV